MGVSEQDVLGDEGMDVRYEGKTRGGLKGWRNY